MAPERYLTDTGVFVRWFLKQQGWEQAHEFRDRFLSEEIELETTVCALFELPHVLRTKGLRSKVMTVDDYRAAVRVIDDFDIRVAAFDVDIREASAVLAATHNLRFFDAVFLERALATDCVLLTCDRPLARVAEAAGVDTEVIGNPAD